MDIALIDYGAGNLTSVRKGFAAVGAEVVTPERQRSRGRTAIVVPGVGHFRDRDARRPVARRHPHAMAAACRCSASASACSGCSKAATKRRICRAWACCRAAVTCCARRREGAARRLEHARRRRSAVAARARRRAPIGAYAYFTHSYAAPVTDATAWRTTTHGTDVRGGRGTRSRLRRAVPSRRSPATTACGCCANFRARSPRSAADAGQTHHRLPRRPRRRGRQGRQLRGAAQRRRSGGARARATTSRGSTSWSSST